MADYVIGEMARARGGAGKAFATQHNMVLPHVPIIPPPPTGKPAIFSQPSVNWEGCLFPKA